MVRFACRGQHCSAWIALVVVAWGSFPAVPARCDDLESSSVIPIARSGVTGDQPLKVKVVKPGDSGRKQRQDAISQLPLKQLTRDQQDEAKGILKDLSLYRRLPTVHVEGDRRVYEYFANHPDVAVSIWRAMEISNVQMWQTGANQFETDTRDGSWGKVDVLMRGPTNYLVTCRGQFQSPALPRPIEARALMHLQVTFDASGKATHFVDLFVSFPSQTVQTIARLVSPVSNRIADRNFEEISLFVELMNLGMMRQPGWIEQLTAKMDGVLPERPEELLSLTASVYIDAERRRLAEAGQNVSLQTIMPPVQEASADGSTPQ